MNALNSILVEGSIVGEVDLETDSKDNVVGYFEIESFRGKESITLIVEARHGLGERVKEEAGKCGGVRVVGRLIQVNGQIRIYAEHIEFKPKPKQV